MSLQYVLPCKYCRDNFKENLKKINFKKSDFKNRETFSKFIYNLHNIVNISLGKSKYKTYEEVAIYYEKFRASCDKKKKKCKEPFKGNIKYKSIITITECK